MPTFNSSSVQLMITADPANSVPERDETNNYAPLLVTVLAPADLQLSGTTKVIDDLPNLPFFPPSADPFTGQTVVDLTQKATTAEQAINWIVRACARRLTTVERLRDTFSDRKKLRFRTPIATVLEDVQAGCHSMLELAYLRRVERAHGLPTAHRQVARQRRGGRMPSTPV